jgi:hypothetical protein
MALAALGDKGDGLSAVERALIEAIPRRFPDEAVDDIGPWLDAYADAMHSVHKAHADDRDVAALFAEAMMNRTPWQL